MARRQGRLGVQSGLGQEVHEGLLPVAGALELAPPEVGAQGGDGVLALSREQGDLQDAVRAESGALRWASAKAAWAAAKSPSSRCWVHSRCQAAALSSRGPSPAMRSRKARPLCQWSSRS